MCCGFATLDLDLSTPLTKETRLVRPVMAGNLDQSVAIKDSEVLARRSGFKAFTQLFSGPVKSQLSLKLAPAHLRDERTVNYLRFLPCNLIAAWSTIEVLKLFLEVLASFILLPQHQPLHVGRTCQLAIQLFLKNIVDTPDMLQVLSEVWSETRKGIKRVALSQHDAGAMQHVSTGPAADPTLDTSPASVLLKFRRCIMRMYPAATLATNVLPPYIVGITDLKRLSLLRVLAHTADPLTVLTSDGMLRGVNATAGAGAGGGAAGVTRAPMSLARAASVQNIKADVAAAAAAASAPQHDPRRPAGLGFNKGVVAASAPDEPLGPDPYVGSVELRNIWAPFHTNEISFDANAHSGECTAPCTHPRRSSCVHRCSHVVSLSDCIVLCVQRIVILSVVMRLNSNLLPAASRTSSFSHHLCSLSTTTTAQPHQLNTASEENCSNNRPTLASMFCTVI